jgi:hypothetical protein
MNERANALADRIEQGAEALGAFIESLSEAEWEMVIPGEERTAGVLVHHVASNYEIEIDLARLLASGEPITGVTWDVIDGMNAEHAEENAIVDKQEVLQMLRETGKAAADRVREFTDQELDSAALVSLNADAPLTAQFFIEDHALRHSFHHLVNIREALKSAVPEFN